MSSPSPPPSPVPAASLILLREGDGLEVLTGRRSLQARAFPGAVAFPGGKIETQDADWPDAGAEILRIAAHCALRETFEETGLLICEEAQGPPAWAEVEVARHAVETGEMSFSDLLRRWDRRPDLNRLTPFAKWVTPKQAPYRFDTYFFLVATSTCEAAAPLICAEFDQLSWSSPLALLRDDSHRLMTPTRHCLTALSGAATMEEAIHAARGRAPYDGETERLRASN